MSQAAGGVESFVTITRGKKQWYRLKDTGKRSFEQAFKVSESHYFNANQTSNMRNTQTDRYAHRPHKTPHAHNQTQY